jgi:uncharacterized protein YjgD (DUF1641 family)
MAQPIPLKLPPQDPREELRRRLDSAPVEHAEAILDSYELLQKLHDRGVLQLVRGALEASDKIVDAAVETARSDESIRALRNTIILCKMLASINPDLLQGIAVAVSDTLGSNRKPVIEPPGLFSLLNQFRRKELRRSIALINRFLETLGKQLRKQGTFKTNG